MTAAAATGPAPSTPSNLPRAFGRYVLFDLIGRGGMADIYLARMGHSLGGHRLCVIKEIRDRFDDDPAFIELLTAEAKLAARLNHANIVQVFDLGRESGRLYLAMDYVEGFDLHQLLKRLSKGRIPLPMEFGLSIVIETLRALDYAHRARDDRGEPMGLVHRDVSPSNVLISFEGEIKLCDFGIARATRLDDSGTQDVAGKAAYMSPEHARGEALDGRADVFAAGILLWELSAGRRLYKGKGDEVLDKARRAEVPRLPERGLPGHDVLQGIVDKALAPRVEDRYESAAQFLDALEDYAIGHRLRASPLRFGAFLSDHFASEIVDVRRERERAADQMVAPEDPESFGPASAPPETTDVDVDVPPPAAVPRESVDGVDALSGDLDEVTEENELSEILAESATTGDSSDDGLASGTHPVSAPPGLIEPSTAEASAKNLPEAASDRTFYIGLVLASLALAAAAYFLASQLL